jgi:MFS transporter, PPP family, 3-phenylpropionic acid transporter
MSPLVRFVVLYAAMYAAFGVSSPFLPEFLQTRGLSPAELGLLFGTGTAIRLVSGPLLGRLADVTRSLRAVLAGCELVAAGASLALAWTRGFTPLLLTGLLQGAALAPTTTLADALAVNAAVGRAAGPRFEYGWVRGTGSAAFVAGTLVSGQVVGARGLVSIVVLQAVLLVAATAAAGLVPRPVGSRTAPSDAALPGIPDPAEPPTMNGVARPGMLALLRIPLFRRIMLIVALVLGSHALHDTFAVIRWSAAGVTPAMTSVLWSESVAAEVLVFFVLGPWLITRWSPAALIATAATAGVVRWIAMALTTNLAVLALAQPLHGLTFAALHLACMRLIPTVVPQELAATGQALYALAAGATTALLTVASGTLYGSLGAHAFLVMAVLCAAVLPLTPGLQRAGRTAA